MSAQTSYAINQAVALAGMLAYVGYPNDITSGVVEGATGVDFGVVVARGTKEGQVVTGGAAALGVTVRELTREGDGVAGSVQYAETETAAVMRSGYIFVTAVNGANPGDAVAYDTTTGVLSSGAPGAGQAALAGAAWETVAAVGELAIIRLA